MEQRKYRPREQDYSGKDLLSDACLAGKQGNTSHYFLSFVEVLAFRPKLRYVLEKRFLADDSLTLSPTQGDTLFALG